MKNILFPPQTISDRTHINISISAFLLVIQIIFAGSAYCQDTSPERTKKILFLSHLVDESSLNSHRIDDCFDNYVTLADSNYKDFNYTESNTLHLNFSNNEKFITDKYSVKLFKINRHSDFYYVLWFESHTSIRYCFFDTLWIRVGGYLFNDVKIFFDRLRELGMTVDEIREMVNVWRTKDPLFDELDWDCIIEGYEKNDTHRECFISNNLSRHNAACKGCRYNVYNDDIYSVFSRVILFGDIDTSL